MIRTSRTTRRRSTPSFIVDGMLGTLARWLRLLGFDTIYCENWSDDDILKSTGTRILLTRDKQLLARAQARGLNAINPGHRSIASQLLRLREQLHIAFEADPARCRCPHCNYLLSPVSRQGVTDRVPAGSLRRYTQFWECRNPDCRQVYWQGRHWQRIEHTLAEANSESSAHKSSS